MIQFDLFSCCFDALVIGAMAGGLGGVSIGMVSIWFFWRKP
jgi:hypothetical protein